MSLQTMPALLEAAREFVRIADENQSDADYQQQVQELKERIQEECKEMYVLVKKAGVAENKSGRSTCPENKKKLYEAEVEIRMTDAGEKLDVIYTLRKELDELIQKNRQRDVELMEAQRNIKKLFGTSKAPGKRPGVEELQGSAAKHAKPQQTEFDLEKVYPLSEIFKLLTNPLRNTTLQLKKRIDARFTGSVVTSFLLSLYDSEELNPGKKNMNTILDLLNEFKTQDKWDEQLRTFCDQYPHKGNGKEAEEEEGSDEVADNLLEQ